ncbi:hypothetical protein [Microcella alkaliphila]|uniref:hypothetical protein n=1 Tax=Microcella alkaliphila TaxID=279828 RepID=UPI000BBA9D2E|nr:hypothetical protein [Microcella alkaliphila]
MAFLPAALDQVSELSRVGRGDVREFGCDVGIVVELQDLRGEVEGDVFLDRGGRVGGSVR